MRGGLRTESALPLLVGGVVDTMNGNVREVRYGVVWYRRSAMGGAAVQDQGPRDKVAERRSEAEASGDQDAPRWDWAG